MRPSPKHKKTPFRIFLTIVACDSRPARHSCPSPKWVMRRKYQAQREWSLFCPVGPLRFIKPCRIHRRPACESQTHHGEHFGLTHVSPLLTPPVGLNLLVLQGITGRQLPRIARFTLPLFLPMCVAVTLIYLFPGIVTWLPQQIGQ